MNDTAQAASGPLYAPYDSAEESEAAYAKYVSSSHAQMLKAADFLNIHYGARENARVQDVYSGEWFWDCHRNGSKFNLGHRNPAVMEALRSAVDGIDAGSFFQLSGHRARLAEKLAASTDRQLPMVTFGVGGADAIEIAVHAARNHTKRKTFVAIDQTSYHGATDLCLSLSGNSARQRKRYGVETPNVTFVPFNNIGAITAAITEETAAVVMEPSPAQGGFPEPDAGYLAAVKQACAEQGAVFIMDEVQTGLGATGSVWAYQQYGFVPDIVCTGKGLGGGVYPISAALMSEAVGRSYTEGQLIPHESTYAGADIGCVVGAAVLDITLDPDFLARVRDLSARFAAGFEDLPLEVTQIGLCMGLRTPNPLKTAAQLLAQNVLVVPSADDDVVPFRPILTLSDEDADDIIQRVRTALA